LVHRQGLVAGIERGLGGHGRGIDQVQNMIALGSHRPMIRIKSRDFALDKTAVGLAIATKKCRLAFIGLPKANARCFVFCLGQYL